MGIKKLFKVKKEFFNNKAEAKMVRDQLGGVKAGVFVQRGPDNTASPKQKYKGGRNKKVTTMSGV